MVHIKEPSTFEIDLYNKYFKWLSDIVMFREMRRSGRSYKKLLEFMRNKQFVCIVDNDVNRANDGKYLRVIFRDETGLPGDAIKGACNFLEMCVALARRINNDIFETDPWSSPAHWFWIMMENCGLDQYTDDTYDELDVNKICDRIILRRYSKTGKGGFFPLKHPKKDQKEEELWYQMQAYVIENFEY